MCVFMYIHACTCVPMHSEVMEQHWALLLLSVGHFVFSLSWGLTDCRLAGQQAPELYLPLPPLPWD